VKHNGWSLEFVPEELKTEELCLEAVRQKNVRVFERSSLEFVPEELKTVELCIEAVRYNGWAVHFVPDELQDDVISLETPTCPECGDMLMANWDECACNTDSDDDDDDWEEDEEDWDDEDDDEDEEEILSE
jgi:hypothetical protein